MQNIAVKIKMRAVTGTGKTVEGLVVLCSQDECKPRTMQRRYYPVELKIPWQPAHNLNRL